MPKSTGISTHTPTITVERIDDGLDVVATAIERFGDVYMPLFIRLEEERAALISRTEAIERVRRRLQANRKERRA